MTNRMPIRTENARTRHEMLAMRGWVRTRMSFQVAPTIPIQPRTPLMITKTAPISILMPLVLVAHPLTVSMARQRTNRCVSVLESDPGSAVNFALFLQKWPKIQHSSPKCLHQSLDLRKRSFSPSVVLLHESDGVSPAPVFG